MWITPNGRVAELGSLTGPCPSLSNEGPEERWDHRWAGPITRPGREGERREGERGKPSRFDTSNRLCFKWFSVNIMQWNEYILCINNNFNSPNKYYWIFQFSLFYYFKLWPQKFQGITKNYITEVAQVIFFHFYSHCAIIVYFLSTV